MDFINQPISELLSPIWNKLYQFLVWLFTTDPSEKCNFYKALVLFMLFLPIYDIYSIFTYSKNIFQNFIGVIASNIIVIGSIILFIEFAFR